MVESAAGTLFVVSTPIGNMGDFSFRAVETLKSVALILAEDTRHSRGLLTHHDIHTRLASYHAHNEMSMIPEVLRHLSEGSSLALISDAGTPLLSDPGERLVRSVIDAGHTVTAIPGASAALAALVVSGLPTAPFTFVGFPPRKGKERAALMLSVAASPATSILYESPNRVADTLSDLAVACGAERGCSVSRELTKYFEETRRGTLADLSEYYNGASPRGEFVIVVAGAAPVAVDEDTLREIARKLRSGGLSTRDVVTTMVTQHGAPRNLAYRLAREE